MRFVLKASAGLHDNPNPTAPSSAGMVNPGDQVDVDGDIAGKDFVRGQVVEPPPRRSGFIATAALESLPPPSPEIDAVSLYTYLYLSTPGTGADQRYLFALAFAESGLKNEASKIAGSDGFGPFQYTSARWQELLASNVDLGLHPEDRLAPFAQARLAIREEVAASAAAHAALSRPVQHNGLYLLHLLPNAAVPAFLNAVKSAPTTSIDAIQADAAMLSQQLKRNVKTIAEALDAAAATLQPGLAKTLELDPLPAAPLPDAGAMKKTSGLAQQALDMLRGAGWSKAQACGIIANIYFESSFDPHRLGDGNTAYGLCQWHGDRRSLFERQFGFPMNPNSTFGQQIDFVTYEMKNGGPLERRAGAELAATTTPSDAADKVCRRYERPLHPDTDSPKRMGQAEAYFHSLT